MFGRLGMTAFGLISALVIAHAIGPSGRGETAAAIALFYILPILLALGVPIEARRLTAKGNAGGVVRVSRRFAGLTAIPTIPIALALAYSLFEDFDSPARIIATVGVVASPATVSWMCNASVVFAQLRFRAFVAIQLTQPGTFLLLVLLAWGLGVADTGTVLLANIAGTLLTFVVALAFTRSQPYDSDIPLKSIVKNGSKYAGSAIAEAASNRLDQVLVLPLMGGFQAGLYSVAVTIAGVPLALGHALGGAFFSSIASAETGTKRTHLKADAFRFAFLLAGISAAILAIATPILVTKVFGAGFEDAILCTWIALAGSIAMVSAYVVAQGLAAEGRGIRMTIAQAISLIFSITMLVVLAPAHGAAGAAIASSLGYLVLLATLLVCYSVPARLLVPTTRDLSASWRAILHGR